MSLLLMLRSIYSRLFGGTLISALFPRRKSMNRRRKYQLGSRNKWNGTVCEDYCSSSTSLTMNWCRSYNKNAKISRDLDSKINIRSSIDHNNVYLFGSENVLRFADKDMLEFLNNPEFGRIERMVTDAFGLLKIKVNVDKHEKLLITTLSSHNSCLERDLVRRGNEATKIAFENYYTGNIVIHSDRLPPERDETSSERNIHINYPSNLMKQTENNHGERFWFENWLRKINDYLTRLIVV
ncbi:hypothetical protein ACOME3_005561 [Neoechinorhynchus agilis]